jgi:hypothetical protein
MAKSFVTGLTPQPTSSSEITPGRYRTASQFQKDQAITGSANEQSLVDNIRTQIDQEGMAASFSIPGLAPQGETLYNIVSSP